MKIYGAKLVSIIVAQTVFWPNEPTAINLILDKLNPGLCHNKNKLIGDGAYKISFNPRIKIIRE